MHPFFNTLRRPALALAAVAVFLSLLSLLSGMRAAVGPYHLRLETSWGWPGLTRLIVPPLGEVDARTHFPPVVFTIALDRAEFNSLSSFRDEFGGARDLGQYIAGLEPRLRSLVAQYLARLLLLGVLSAGISAWLFGWRAWRKLAAAAAAGLFATLVLVGGSALTFRKDAFENPRYEGALEGAPWVMQLVEKGFASLPALGEKLSVVAGNLSQLSSRADTLGSLTTGDGELKILHVSDIHNHPAALDLIQRVSGEFAVDLIVDTGDLTDFGTELEMELTGKIGDLGVKYLFIPGNHDSPDVIRGLRRFRNVTVLEAGSYEFKGLRIAGWADPASRVKGLITADESDFQAETGKLQAYLGGLARPPDLLAVHNRRLAAPLEGKIPLVLHGHDHRAAITQEGATLYVDAGTTGAAGLRGLEGKEVPYSLALLHFGRADGEGGGYRLNAVDMMKVYGQSGEIQLERKAVAAGEEVPGGGILEYRGGETSQPTSLGRTGR